MSLSQLTLGAPQAVWWAVLLVAAGIIALAWSAFGGRRVGWQRAVGAGLKVLAFVLLGACLVDPLFTSTRPRPGANLFLVVADNSQSLQLANHGSDKPRSTVMQELLIEQVPWIVHLGQDFEVRRYAFDSSLHSVKTFAEMKYDGEASSLGSALTNLADRFRDRPLAGILLLTDGNATDALPAGADLSRLPPIYPVPIGDAAGLVDISVSQVAVSQTNFEAAPVTLTAQIEGQAVVGKEIIVRVLDEAEKEVERHTLTDLAEGKPSAQRFLIRPEHPGISFYTVQAFLKNEETLPSKPGRTIEATLANNTRIATVDRGGGPYRVLYVCGRPNWEFKFLRRALAEDDEVGLVGLVRVARREPKFTFLGQLGERTNPLFRGFGNQQDEQAEQYDQPVLIRLNTEDEHELFGGFPKNTEDLFRYHAVIIDDLEAAFFNQDQLTLLQQFVSRRGGGLMMLGGKESFSGGNYQHTPVAEMLPVYLDRLPVSESDSASYALDLTRDGWLQPWVRLRTTEPDERARLAGMPEFKTLNHVSTIKPGASILAQVTSTTGRSLPALVVQQFGKGRTAAMLIGDLWRWNMRRADATQSDLEKSWRQTVRWLVSDVPTRVAVETERMDGGPTPAVKVVVRARDERFEPLDNATVNLHVTTPDQRAIEMTAESSDRVAGEYTAVFAPRAPGVYRASATVLSSDGSEVGKRQTGWAVEPKTEEFRRLEANRTLLEGLAESTQGEIVEPGDLHSFVSSLSGRKVPVTETWTWPLWHRWPVFLAAVVCLIGEWGLRRWKGLP